MISMGMFKRVKDMKHAIESAPGTVAQAKQRGAQAHQTALARQAAMQAQMRPVQPHWSPMQPQLSVAGVSLEEFVAVSKGLSTCNHDLSELTNVAATYGIDTFTWEQAARGWNDRIRSSPAVAQRFRQLYLAVSPPAYVERARRVAS
jgi:uncharacterized protein DUF6620